MKFDYTGGQKAKYCVGLYGFNVMDFYYFSEYKRAKEMYDKLKRTKRDGLAVSLYNMAKDERKFFSK